MALQTPSFFFFLLLLLSYLSFWLFFVFFVVFYVFFCILFVFFVFSLYFFVVVFFVFLSFLYFFVFCLLVFLSFCLLVFFFFFFFFFFCLFVFLSFYLFVFLPFFFLSFCHYYHNHGVHIYYHTNYCSNPTIFSILPHIFTTYFTTNFTTNHYHYCHPPPHNFEGVAKIWQQSRRRRRRRSTDNLVLGFWWALLLHFVHSGHFCNNVYFAIKSKWAKIMFLIGKFKFWEHFCVFEKCAQNFYFHTKSGILATLIIIFWESWYELKQKSANDYIKTSVFGKNERKQPLISIQKYIF